MIKIELQQEKGIVAGVSRGGLLPQLHLNNFFVCQLRSMRAVLQTNLLEFQPQEPISLDQAN